MAIPTFAQHVELAQPTSRIIWKGFERAGQLPSAKPLLTPFAPEPLALEYRSTTFASPWSYGALGVFCKAEVKMNRWFPIPVMVRLGDVQRAEELDGKGAYRGPH